MLYLFSRNFFLLLVKTSVTIIMCLFLTTVIALGRTATYPEQSNIKSSDYLRIDGSSGVEAKLSLKKKILVSGSSDWAVIWVHLIDRKGLPMADQKIECSVTGDIDNRYLNYIKKVTTDKNGWAKINISSSVPGFIEAAFMWENIRIDTKHILFAPNIYFRKGRSSKATGKYIRKDENDAKITSIYEGIKPKFHWWSRHPYGWGTHIETHKGPYRGILIHHTAGRPDQTVQEEEKRLIYKFNQGKKRNRGKEKKEFLDDLSYNFYINRKGQVKAGRSLYYRGGHAGRDAGVPGISDLNNDTIGIVFFGNYHNSKYIYKRKFYVWHNNKKIARYRWVTMPMVTMTVDQQRAAKALVIMLGYLFEMDLSKKYPDEEHAMTSMLNGKPARWLDGHGAFKDKNCPGHDIHLWLERERESILKSIELLKD